MSFKLYEIDELLRDAIDAATESVDENGVLPDDWAAFLDAVQMERDVKALAVAAVVRERLAEAEAVKAETQRLQKKQRAAEAVAERLKSYLAAHVSAGEKLQDCRVSICWRKSSAVVIDDESLLPEECFRVVRTVSKTDVKAGLQSGVITTGARIEGRLNIQIR